mgnify:CR=1 FL=1
MRHEKRDLVVETFPVGSLSCNCSIVYSVKTLEAIIIDPGNDCKKVLEQVNKHKLTVKLLIHTHAHFDHIGQSDELRSLLGCRIYLHRDDLFLYEMLPQQGIFFGETIRAPQPVDHFFSEEEYFSIRTQEDHLQEPQLLEFLKTLHTPGHTPGSCSFYSDYFDPPLLFSGDTLFSGSIGRTDLPGGDSLEIIKSIKKKIFLLPEETVCIPGHGPKTWVYQEKNTNPFL